jgi:uncharacterized LabA/DUF88 family protein
VAQDDRLRIAVFIDFDNIEIGVKNTLGASFDAGLVLEALKERGDVVSKTAYSDWQRAGSYSRSLTQHAIKMVQRNLTPGGDKNGADINLALDALEMAFTHPHINAFVIVGGDSDFISLVEKLKQYDKKIFVVGGRQFTSIIMQKNCHEFISYENLVAAAGGTTSGGGRRPSERGVRVDRMPIEQAIPLVTRGLKVLADREVSPQLGLLKSTLLQLDSTFSERSYGAGSFRDFIEKLEKVGVVKMAQGKGGWIVSANEDAPELPELPVSAAEEGDLPGVDAPIEAAGPRPVREGREPREPREGGEGRDGRDGGRDGGREGGRDGRGDRQGAAPAQAGSNADGVKEFARLLSSGQVRRWPMYLRNVKQVLRQVDATFDERAYGFANLVELLRAAGKDGIVRVDRDRQGVIRVFQGSAAPAQVPSAPAGPSRPKVFDIEDELEEIERIREANLRARAEAAARAAAAAAGGTTDADVVEEEGESSDVDDQQSASDEPPVTVHETVIAIDELSGAVTEYVVSDEVPEGDQAEEADAQPDAKKRTRRKPAAKPAAKDKAPRARKPRK